MGPDRQERGKHVSRIRRSCYEGKKGAKTIRPEAAKPSVLNNITLGDASIEKAGSSLQTGGPAAGGQVSNVTRKRDGCHSVSEGQELEVDLFIKR